MMPRHIVGISLVFLAMSYVGVDAYAKLNKSKPIRIDFEQKPPKKIDQGDVYVLNVSWRNTDKLGSYEGSFVLISTAEGIKAECLTFIFEGSTIMPQESANTLTFTLPTQIFLPGTSGVVSVEIVYFKAGTYKWDIAIAQFS